jgi:hypothetical protein
MVVRELSSVDWKKFCERFTELLRETPVTVEFIDEYGILTETAHDLPLQRMVFDKDDPCNDIIVLECGEPYERPETHLIVEPIHVRLRQQEGGRKILQINSENGVHLIHFHHGKVFDLLHGLNWS